MDGLGWSDIIKIVLASGVVATIISSGITWVKEKAQRDGQRKLDAEFDAIHLISKLDALAVRCANNFWEYHKLWNEARGTIHERDVAGCTKPDIAIDAASLSKIDRSLACRIAWLENDISLGADEIRSRWEAYMDTDDANEHYANLVGYFGYEALMISKLLRAKYSLTHEGPRWGMPQIEQQLKTCFDATKLFFKEDN